MDLPGNDLTVEEFLLKIVAGAPLATSYDPFLGTDEGITYVYRLTPGFLLRVPKVPGDSEPAPEFARRLKATTNLYPANDPGFNFGQVVFMNKNPARNDIESGFQIVAEVPGESMRAMARRLKEKEIRNGKNEGAAEIAAFHQTLEFLAELPPTCFEGLMQQIQNMTRNGLFADLTWGNIIYNADKQTLTLIDPIFEESTLGGVHQVNRTLAEKRAKGEDTYLKYLSQLSPVINLMDFNSLRNIAVSLTLSPFNFEPPGQEMQATVQKLTEKLTAAARVAGVAADGFPEPYPPGNLSPAMRAAVQAVPPDIRFFHYGDTSVTGTSDQPAPTPPREITKTTPAETLLARLRSSTQIR